MHLCFVQMILWVEATPDRKEDNSQEEKVNRAFRMFDTNAYVRLINNLNHIKYDSSKLIY